MSKPHLLVVALCAVGAAVAARTSSAASAASALQPEPYDGADVSRVRSNSATNERPDMLDDIRRLDSPAPNKRAQSVQLRQGPLTQLLSSEFAGMGLVSSKNNREDAPDFSSESDRRSSVASSSGSDRRSSVASSRDSVSSRDGFLSASDAELETAKLIIAQCEFTHGPVRASGLWRSVKLRFGCTDVADSPFMHAAVETSASLQRDLHAIINEQSDKEWEERSRASSEVRQNRQITLLSGEGARAGGATNAARRPVSGPIQYLDETRDYLWGSPDLPVPNLPNLHARDKATECVGLYDPAFAPFLQPAENEPPPAQRTPAVSVLWGPPDAIDRLYRGTWSHGGAMQPVQISPGAGVRNDDLSKLVLATIEAGAPYENRQITVDRCSEPCKSGMYTYTCVCVPGVRVFKVWAPPACGNLAACINEGIPYYKSKPNNFARKPVDGNLRLAMDTNLIGNEKSCTIRRTMPDGTPTTEVVLGPALRNAIGTVVNHARAMCHGIGDITTGAKRENARDTRCPVGFIDAQIDPANIFKVDDGDDASMTDLRRAWKIRAAFLKCSLSTLPRCAQADQDELDHKLESVLSNHAAALPTAKQTAHLTKAFLIMDRQGIGNVGVIDQMLAHLQAAKGIVGGACSYESARVHDAFVALKGGVVPRRNAG